MLIPGGVGHASDLIEHPELLAIGLQQERVSFYLSVSEIGPNSMDTTFRIGTTSGRLVRWS